jgi:hypothetical protein
MQHRTRNHVMSRSMAGSFKDCRKYWTIKEQVVKQSQSSSTRHPTISTTQCNSRITNPTSPKSLANTTVHLRKTRITFVSPNVAATTTASRATTRVGRAPANSPSSVTSNCSANFYQSYLKTVSAHKQLTRPMSKSKSLNSKSLIR